MIDVVLTVHHDIKKSTLSYTLDVRNPELGEIIVRDEAQTLSGNAFDVLDALFGELDEMLPPPAEDEGDELQETVRELQGIGEQFFVELIPEKIRERLQRLPEGVSLQIQSDETLIPWELLRMPGDPGAFLAEAFGLTRWLLGHEQTDTLPLSHLALVTPRDSQLDHTGDEHDFIVDLESETHRVTDVEATSARVMALFDAGVHDGWHFTGHGLTASDDPNAWSLMLEGEDKVTAYKVKTARNLRAARPVIFANACHSGRGGPSLTRTSGLARAFLEAGAGAFVGSHWAIDDAPASVFACAFYESYLNGMTMAEAVRRARFNVRERFPGNPIWLAYTAFAHPLAVCKATPGALKTPEPVEPPLLSLPPVRASRTLPAAVRRKIAVAALLVLPIALAILGQTTHSARETMLRLSSPLSYPVTALLWTGTQAVGSLLVNALTAPFSSRFEIRVSAWALIVLTISCWGAFRSQRRWPLAGYMAGCVAMALTAAVLWVSVHLYTFALRARHPEEQPRDSNALCSNYFLHDPAKPGKPAPITEQIVVESCSWLDHPTGSNEEWRQSLSGLAVFFLLNGLLALRGGLHMGRLRGWLQGVPLALIGANAIVLFLTIRQLPLAHAYDQWGLEYPSVTQVDTPHSELSRAITEGGCCVYDVSEGANETVLLLWGSECPVKREQRWDVERPRLERQTRRTVTSECGSTRR